MSIGRKLMRVARIQDYISKDLLGGYRISFFHAIGVPHCLTIFICLLFMVSFHTYTAAAFVSAALAGSFGFVSVIRQLSFPEGESIELTIPATVVMWVFVLGPYYWISSFIIAKNQLDASNFRLFVVIVLFIVGLVFRVGGDCQKVALRGMQGSRALVTVGFFRYVREPIYLGEMLMSGSLASLANHWLVWLVIFAIWATMYFPKMWLKEVIFRRRYPAEWTEYVKRTGMLIPKFW